MLDIIIHNHALSHGLTKQDIAYAWGNFIKMQPRGNEFEVRIGFDAQGRDIGMVAAKLGDGDVLIIHAKHPAISSIKRELGE